MSNLCKYSDRLGKPMEGIHSYRIFNIAIVDLALTVVFSYIIYYLFNKLFHWKISFWIYLVIILVIGIFAHRIFCVKTTVDKLLFPS